MQEKPEYLEPKALKKQTISDEKIGKAVKLTAKGLIVFVSLVIFALGLQNLGNRAKQFFYKDKYAGLESFKETCEIANHVEGGCKELGNQMTELEWFCSPSKSDKKKVNCELGGQNEMV
jgi:hypothetical protein